MKPNESARWTPWLAALALGCSERTTTTIDADEVARGRGGDADVPSDMPFRDIGDGGGLPFQPSDPDCVQDVSTADVVPVDLYMMFDQSRSMADPAGAGSRLDAVRAAIADFVRDPKSDGLGLGVGYFGYQPRGETTCDPGDYATPDVPIGALPGVSNAVLTSLNAVEPIGETPTGAAITGACTVAAAQAEGHPDHVVAILLVTDGTPEAPTTAQNGGGCNPTLQQATAAAGSCLDGSGIRTYVLGVGSSLSNLNEIAAAGGTDAAQLVESGDVTRQVLDALRAIRGDVVPCEFEIPEPPEGEELDYETVNVQFTPGGGVPEGLYNVDGASGCGDEGGWYYDDSLGQILLCPTTCERVGTDPAGSLEYALGCVETLILR